MDAPAFLSAKACRSVPRGATFRGMIVDRGYPTVKTIKTYSTRFEADVARIALDAAGIPAEVLGVETAMEGGSDGVRLRVQDEHAEAAVKVLKR